MKAEKSNIFFIAVNIETGSPAKKCRNNSVTMQKNT